MALKISGKLATTEDAHAVLRHTRTKFITQARVVARHLCEQHGTTHARRVHDEMEKLHLLDSTVPDYWMGVVFRSPEFYWTGKWVEPPVPTGTTANIHSWRLIKVWGLVKLFKG